MDLENKTQGYIRLHRSLSNSDFYKDSAYVHIWIHLLLKANHSKSFFDGIKLNPGQFKTGRKIFSKETGINESKIDRVLNFFESEQQIEQQKTNKFRIITIKNWEQYQKVNSEVNNSEQQRNNNATTTQQQKTQTIHVLNDTKVLNDIKVIKEKIYKKESFKIPTIQEIHDYMNEYCNSKNIDVDLLEEPSSFFDTFEARGWVVGKARNPMKCWKSAIRNWFRNKKEWNKSKQSNLSFMERDNLLKKEKKEKENNNVREMFEELTGTPL